MYNLDPLIRKIQETVASHEMADRPGAYARYRRQNAPHTRLMGSNEYGCADAANIRYTTGNFPCEPAVRAAQIRELQVFQNPETGLFHEATHHPFHTTAHCTAALELFDARPLHPLAGLAEFKRRDGLYKLLESLEWLTNPWPQSHQGAGVFAALTIAENPGPEWQQWYFDWLREHCDPEFGMSLKGAIQSGGAPTAYHLYGWFHYLFNHVYAHRPFPYAEKLIDTCLTMYAGKQHPDCFGREVGFMEIDWVFALHRAIAQTGHRFAEATEQLRDLAAGYVPYLDGLDPETDDNFDDLHMLFGAVTTLAELQLALPGEYVSTVPLKNVLDRRPFI